MVVERVRACTAGTVVVVVIVVVVGGFSFSLWRNNVGRKALLDTGGRGGKLSCPIFAPFCLSVFVLLLFRCCVPVRSFVREAEGDSLLQSSQTGPCRLWLLPVAQRDVGGK